MKIRAGTSAQFGRSDRWVNYEEARWMRRLYWVIGCFERVPR